jgi:hypothetical protein
MDNKWKLVEWPTKFEFSNDPLEVSAKDQAKADSHWPQTKALGGWNGQGCFWALNKHAINLLCGPIPMDSSSTSSSRSNADRRHWLGL